MRYLCLFIMLWACCLGCKTSKKANSAPANPSKTEEISEIKASHSFPDFLAQKMLSAGESANLRIQKFDYQGETYYAYNGCYSCPDNMVQIFNAKGENKANCGGIAGFRGELCNALNGAAVIFEQKPEKKAETAPKDE